MCWFRRKKAISKKPNEYRFVEEKKLSTGEIYWYTEVNGFFLSGSLSIDRSVALDIFNQVKNNNLTDAKIKNYIINPS